MKEEQENQEVNAEQHGDRASNFLGEIPEAWQRRARAAFGYTFCVVMLIAIPCVIAARIFPAVTWLSIVLEVFGQIGSLLYHYGVGLTFGIAAPCLAWEGIMYLREKRAREREQRAREQAEAVVTALQKEVSTLRNEVTYLRGELDQLKGQSQPHHNGGEN